MTGFRVLLIAMFGVLMVFTSLVIGAHGWGLMAIFFGDIAKMGWPGQFNLDFLFMLTLSALWVAWRHAFSAVGFGLALLALFGGSGFLTVYLFIVSLRAKGGMSEILIGPSRAARQV